MQGHQPHPVTPMAETFQIKRGKRRGSYNCGRCGQPKKGHVCNFTTSNPSSTSAATPISTPIDSSASSSAVRPPPAAEVVPLSRQPSVLRRALSFDDADDVDFPGSVKNEEAAEGEVEEVEEEEEEEEEEVLVETDVVEFGSGKLPVSCLWDVLRRLPPPALMSAAGVCRGWRDTARRLWRAAEELRLRVPAKAQSGLVGSVLHKCPSLVRLSLRMESDVDSTTLACIAFSCPNLESMEIFTSSTSVNRITGDELSRFVAERRSLSNLKVEGCSNLGSLVLSSSSLSTLWLSDLYSLSKIVFNCPNLKEISLNFSRQENDRTDLTTMMDCLGRSCPRLQNIYIASVRLSHADVLALTAANLRGLRMLSLVLGSEITDASVAAIASSYSNLELLDLSGSGISDSGIGMICNIFPDTLSKLLLALCPNITSSGIQFATAQLPYLELMDCGMTISDPNLESETSQENSELELQKTPNNKLHLIYQKLIIKHSRLKKLSLWGCSGLDALYLNCPQLADLNLNLCSNLHSERLLLQCPNLESVHAAGCQDLLVDTIQSQVCSNFSAVENHFPCKHLPDGSKRVRVPHLLSPQPSEDWRKRRRISKRPCAVLVN